MPFWHELCQAVVSGETVALATVVLSTGSTPRAPGASLLLRPDGAVAGAVSGGCVEADLLETANEVISTGLPQLRHYAGIDTDDPFSIGLTCGGSLDVVIESFAPGSDPERAALEALVEAVSSDQPSLLVSRLDGFRGLRLWSPRGSSGTLGSISLDAAADAAWARVIDANQGSSPHGPNLSCEWPSRAWLEPTELPECSHLVLRLHQSRPPLWIIGAIDTSAALAELGRQLGYRVTVVDARLPFATLRRFPMADAVVCEWPDTWMARQTISADTVIAVLTHDPKFDIPALCLALRSPAAYVGAMGSRRTNADRLARLHEAGLSGEEIGRLRAPIGLDLGGRSAQEIAISILAEVVMLRNRGHGLPLCSNQGPIHHE